MRDVADALPTLIVEEGGTDVLLIGETVNVIKLQFEHKLIAQNGLAWPPMVKVAVGNEALIKLKTSVEGQSSCVVRSPRGQEFDIFNTPPSDKYERWSDGCGVRIKDVRSEDLGRWRLSSTRGNNSLTGWSELHVLEDTTRYDAPPISLQDGAQAKVELSSLDNSYCVVAKPFSDSSLVPGKCSVTLDRTTRAVQGNWQVYLGLPGQVSELQTNRHVTVHTERLDVGYVHANKKIHLYCNILNSDKEITFCRFQKASNMYGFNVVDGLSDGTHSYYGEGFALKQCGMTIESPKRQDYGSWRCSVGVQMLVGTVMQPQTPMQALISVPVPKTLNSVANADDKELMSVFVTVDSPFTISCHAEVSLNYCWFQHPNGTQFTPVASEGAGQLFWYTGQGLDLGDCGVTFAHANSSDSGIWKCYMGPRGTAGIEMTDKVQVRVTGPLAANKQRVSVSVGDSATLYCHTANGRRALNYCRFLSPKFLGLSVDETVTKNKAILDRFYFTPNRSIDVGDCSLNIISVQEEDVGEWTCAAVVDGEVLESRDTVTLYIGDQSYPLYQAGLIGTAVGVAVLVFVFIGFMGYKRGWYQLLGLRPARQDSSAFSEAPVTFSTRSRSLTSTTLSSCSSEDSAVQRQ
ncbi:uncharacterized protein LOC116778674 isoform X1 [Danaus plexippus]|nr:uncharacterized protein LOC116778674 isoform X1 [Danaus plexippus]